MRFPAVIAGRAVWLTVAVALMALALAGCQAGGSAGTASASGGSSIPPAGKMVWNGSYAQNIQPIFDQRCVSCHGQNRAENGLRLDSYEGVMKGTEHGQVVVPGDPSRSALISVVKGTADPSIRMPHGGQRLSDEELQNLTLWIEAGAPRQ